MTERTGRGPEGAHHLVANLLVFHNLANMTRAMQKMDNDGHLVSDELAAAVSPYPTEHINRFGNYKPTFGRAPDPAVLEFRKPPKMRDKKLIDVARSVGYESDAAFSKAFKRVVGANPGGYLKRGI